MRILTRYVLSELIKVFLIALTGMTLFMVLVGVSREALSQGLGLKQILMLIPYILPDALRFAVPGTILFAACSVYGRMASSNEVVAIKAQGISPLVILWPTFAFAALISLAAVWLNDVAASWGREGTRRVVIESVVDIIYSRLEQQHSYSSKQFFIDVKRVEGEKLIQPTFSFSGDSDEKSITIICEWAELHSDLTAGTLTMICHHGTFDEGGMRGAFPGTLPRTIALTDASKRGNRSASDIATYRIPEELRLQREEIDATQQRLAMEAATELIDGDFTSLTGKSWDDSERLIVEDRARLYRLLMEPQRRWANGFSCLCFVLVGAPLAIIFRNADFLTSFFICFLPILLIYYPLLIVGVDQAKLGTLPPWSVWTGNVILVLIGIWLQRRVYRY